MIAKIIAKGNWINLSSFDISYKCFIENHQLFAPILDHISQYAKTQFNILILCCSIHVGYMCFQQFQSELFLKY